MGSGHDHRQRQKGAIVTLVDRKSRYLRMGLVSQRTKEAVKEMIISLLAGFQFIPSPVIMARNLLVMKTSLKH